jgi:hypothetical protein
MAMGTLNRDSKDCVAGSIRLLRLLRLRMQLRSAVQWSKHGGTGRQDIFCVAL